MLVEGWFLMLLGLGCLMFSWTRLNKFCSGVSKKVLSLEESSCLLGCSWKPVSLRGWSLGLNSVVVSSRTLGLVVCRRLLVGSGRRSGRSGWRSGCCRPRNVWPRRRSRGKSSAGVWDPLEVVWDPLEVVWDPLEVVWDPLEVVVPKEVWKLRSSAEVWWLPWIVWSVGDWSCVGGRGSTSSNS